MEHRLFNEAQALPAVSPAAALAYRDNTEKLRLQVDKAMAALTDILLFHVTEGRRGAISVLSAPRYQMLNGDKLTRYMLLKAGIAKVNVSASNGVIHVINNVLTPPAN